MAAPGPVILYDHFALRSRDGTFDIDADAFYMALVLSTSNFATGSLTKWGDVTNEIAAAFGYTAGGQALTSVIWSPNAAKAKFSSAPVVWNAAGGALTARGAVIYKLGTANGLVNPLVGRMLLDSTPADVTAPNGTPFIVSPDTVIGWFTSGPGTLT